MRCTLFLARRRQATTRHKVPHTLSHCRDDHRDKYNVIYSPKGGFVACRNWQMLSAHFSLISRMGAKGAEL